MVTQIDLPCTIRPTKRLNLYWSEMEVLDKTVQNIFDGYKHNLRWSEMSNVALPSQIWDSRNFEMLTNTGEDYNTAKTKLDEYFSWQFKEFHLQDFPIPTSNTTSRRERWTVCHQITQTICQLWLPRRQQGDHISHCATIVFQNAYNGLPFKKAS